MVSQTIDSYNSIRIQLQSFLRIDPLTPVSTAPMPTDTDANSGVNGISKRKSKISKHAAVDSTGTFTTSDSCDGSPGSASSDSFDKFGSTCSSPVPGKHHIQTNHSDIYDHSRCTDCCLSQTLAIDCIEHLSTLDAQAMETSRCLRTLVETREKMRDIVECSDNDSESVSYALPPTSIFSSGAGQGMFRNTGSVRKDGLEGGRESSGMNTHSSTQNHSASVESTRSSILPSLNIVSSFGNFISSVYDDFSSQASGPSTQSHGPSTVGSGGGIGQHQHTASGARSLRSSRSSTGSFTDRSVETERSRGSARISGVNINLNTNGVASSGGGNNGVSFSTSPDPSFIGISSSGLRSDNNSNGSHAYTRVHPTSVNSSTAQNSSAAASPANAGSTNSLSLLTETNIKALQQIQIQTHHLADQRRSRPPSVASSASSASSSSSIKSRSRSMSTTSKESASSTTSSASRKSGKCSTDGSSKDNRERAVSAANSMASKVESKLISQQLAQQLETIHIRKKLSVDDSMPERLPASPTAPWSDIPISIIPRTRSLSNDGKDMAYSGNKLSPSHTPIRAGVMGSGYYHSPVYSAASMPRDSMSIYAKNQLSPTSKDEV